MTSAVNLMTKSKSPSNQNWGSFISFITETAQFFMLIYLMNATRTIMMFGNYIKLILIKYHNSK